MSINELADAAGLSRRAVRFYVERGLLPPPLGVGRGRHYDARHLERLGEIAAYQDQGYALDAIGRLLRGETVPIPPLPGRTQPDFEAELWTRVKLMDGVELHLDTARRRPSADFLNRLRAMVLAEFAPDVARRDATGSRDATDETLTLPNIQTSNPEEENP